MIPRYARAEMSRVWEEERRLQRWLDVELAVCDALATAGLVPKAAAAAIRAKARFDVARVREIEATVQHDVIAFLTNVAEHVGPEARYIHLGLTSNDVVDTAQALQMVEAADLLLRGLEGLAAAVERRAFEHRGTVTVGRTHGMHAEPTTFGLKLALWHAGIGRDIERLRAARQRVAVGKLSGAVGTFAHLDPEIEAAALKVLGLAPVPVASQVIQRDRHAEFIGAIALAGTSIERFATEIRHLQRTEVGEVEEPFGRGQKGSSAMPHKKNPVGCEQMSGLARLLRGYLGAALENVVLWHERDISHSSAERVILPDATILLDYMLDRFTRIVSGMVVHKEAMRRNLEATGGLVFSGTVLLALAQKGVSREAAYASVQKAALGAQAGQGDFKTLLQRDPDVTRHLGPGEIDRCFDLAHHLRHVDTLFRRAFGRV
ncbi:MAG TPA: adenylosuccinate lyase [Candidatus Polarisedimenticolia bacterium]|nr:adenylosuccinate lyase [Candidatus Polarisedimenticolia bacterium]